MRVLSADWVCPVSGPPIAHGYIVVDGDRIVRVETSAPEGPVEDFSGCALIPGFVNTHTHLELTVMRGFLENLPFASWIRQLTRTKYECLSRDDLEVSARLGALECLEAGVTCVGEVMDIGSGWDAMRETGLRGVAYQEVFGPGEDSAEESAADLRRKIAALAPEQSDLQRFGVSPHAAYTVSPRLYGLVREIADAEELPMAVHVAESAAETLFVRDAAGPFADALRARTIGVSAQGVGPLAYLERLGILGERTLAIHAIEVEAGDIQRLAGSGTRVAHCPKSNLKLGHGIAPVDELLDAGVVIGLGTDSVANNNTVDMFEEMRTAVLLQRSRTGDPAAIGAARALEMATLGGARSLGLDRHLGSLEPGKLADMVVVDLKSAATQPVFDPVDAIVFSANRANLRAVFLGGERVRIDASETIADAQAIAEKMKSDEDV